MGWRGLYNGCVQPLNAHPLLAAFPLMPNLVASASLHRTRCRTGTLTPEPICTVYCDYTLSGVGKCRTALCAADAISVASVDAGGASACKLSPTQLCHGPCHDWRARLQWVVYEYLKRIASQRRTLVGEPVCAR